MAKFARGQFELHLAFGVGLGRYDAAARQSITNLPPGQWSAVVIRRRDRALDFLAPVKHLAVDVDHQPHRLGLILVDGKAALERLVGLLVAQYHAVITRRAGGRQQQMRVKSAEGTQRNLLFAKLPVAAVEHFERVFLAGADRVRVALHLTNHAANVSHLAGAIGRPVGVDVTLFAQALGHADAA